LKPTGNKDPFALRRNALGLTRTLIEGGLDFNLRDHLSQARRAALCACVANAEKAVGDAKGEKEAASARKALEEFTALRDGDASSGVEELYDFILERLRGYYADKGVPVQQFNAVAAMRPASLADFDRRIAAIGHFAALPEAEALAAANKRIGNILRKAEDAIPEAVDRALLRESAELALAAAVDAAIADTDGALARGDSVAVLGRLAALRPPVGACFAAVVGTAEAPALRRHRRGPGPRRLRRGARRPGRAAPGGGRVLRRGDGERRGPGPAPQPPGPAQAPVGAAGQRGGDRAPVGLSRRRARHAPACPH